MFSRTLTRAFTTATSSATQRMSRSPRPGLTLSRLPVPDLHQTLGKYVKSLEPFLWENAEKGGTSFETSHAIRTQWAEDFEKGIGRELQDRLLQLDDRSPHNWLDDNFWLKKAYHEWRTPVLINSNWWLAFNFDPGVPESIKSIRDRSSYEDATITDWQVRRAACLVYGVLDFKTRLERQELHPSTTRAGIWLQTTTAKLWNICRVPQRYCDSFTTLPHKSAPAARTVVVSIRDWFYAMDVIDEALQPLPAAVIERKLGAIVRDANNRLEKGEKAEPVGVLSADDRDRWAENLGHLLDLSPQNCAVFDTISHSLFALALDHETHVLQSSVTSPPSINSRAEVTAHLHNIRSGHPIYPARSRWYDKPLTLIVEPNTRAGAMGEHSPCDALVPSMVCEYAVVHGMDEHAFSLSGHDDDLEGWRRLDWVTDEYIREECRKAEERAKELVADSDDGILWYDRYGTDWIKNHARLSPDAYIQMALQLAWYRTRRTFTATYETALTRLFKNGRTETIRTLTTDSQAFVLAMMDPSTSTRDRYALLSRAVQTHTGLTRQATMGRGIDRHLLGLYQMLKPGECHALFEDRLFMESQTWKLSTSGLSAGHQFRGTGFGASYGDGYGINYLAGTDIIKFGIECKAHNQLTCTDGFILAVEQALDDLQSVCSLHLFAHL